MKRSIVMYTIMSLLITSGSVFGHATGTSYYWNASTPNYNPSATIHTGTIDTSYLVFADFLGKSSYNPYADNYGVSGAWNQTDGWYGREWDDSWFTTGAGDLNANGDALDRFWVSCGSPCWWDLGTPSSTVVVFGSQCNISYGWEDYLEEGLEYKIFGANTLWDDTSLGSLATVTDIYLDGWHPHNPAEDDNSNGWCTDDVTGVLDLHGSYRYVVVMPWSRWPEIDAIATVIPAPGALVLGSIGVGLVGWLRRRRTL